MKRSISHSLLIGILWIAISIETRWNTEAAAIDAPPLRAYEINKRVKELPGKEDFSTPEAAYAVINRVIARGQESAWRRISIKELAERLPPTGAKNVEVSPENAQMWLNAKILEIRIFREVHAGVIAEISKGSSPPRYDLRLVDLEDDRWLNSGQSILSTLEKARIEFAELCGRHAEKSSRPKIADPESYLKPFVEFLKANGEEPKNFILNALANHKIVIMGEIHNRPHYLAFNATLVSDPRFPETVGTIYLEYPYNDQQRIDKFLAAKELDTTPVIEMLRDMFELGWPCQPTLDFFVAVWKVNQTLPVEKRIRIVLVDMQRPWEEIHKREDWRKYDTDRNLLMANNILKDFRDQPDEKRNALFIVGFYHAPLNLKYPDRTTPMNDSAGYYLVRELGLDNVYTIIPHGPVMTNRGDVLGRRCLGLFDSAFAALHNRPIAFSLETGPFGEQFLDAMPERPVFGTYRDGYNAYLYLGLLEDEILSPMIPGFYTDEFAEEIDRRYRLMDGKGVVESLNLDKLDGETIAAFRRTWWGQPRKNWRYMGPINAWHDGDDWEDVIREKQYHYAMKHPEIIADAAKKLFNAIRDADYGHPETLLKVPYRVDKWHDVWRQWVCKKFKENPIQTVELGQVFRGEYNRPAIPYKLTLKNGEVLEGFLPFEYMPRAQYWEPVYGLDWHLKEE